MKIQPAYLFILPWPIHYLGGVNQAVKSLREEILKNYNAIVLIADWNSPKPVSDVIDGIQIIRWRIRHYSNDMSLMEKIKYLMWENCFSRKFHRLCKENNIKAINIHYVNNLAITISRTLEIRDIRLPLILSFHGSDLDNLSNKSDSMTWIDTLSNNITVSCSDNLAKKITEKLNFNCNINVIHNGFSPRSFEKNSEIKRPIQGEYILNIGKYDKVKGQDILLQAFSRIHKNHPDISLVLIGASGSFLEHLKAMSISLGIDNKVYFFENKPHHELAEFYKYALCFTLPSRSEAFPLSILEASFFSLPVIAANVGGVSELIKDGDTGFLVLPNDVSNLTLALESLLSGKSDGKKVAHRLNELVAQQFTWHKASDEYIKLIDNYYREQ